VFGICGDSIITFIHIWPYIHHYILLNNNSQLSFSKHLVTEYFIDQEKYFSLIILHTLAAYYIGSVAMVATGTTLMAYLQHTCGMFNIAR